jgi:magnesium chelatase subunit I
VLSALLERLEPDGIGEGPAAVGIAASVLEFAMEGLHLNKRLAKDSDGSSAVYGAGR